MYLHTIPEHSLTMVRNTSFICPNSTKEHESTWQMEREKERACTERTPRSDHTAGILPATPLNKDHAPEEGPIGGGNPLLPRPSWFLENSRCRPHTWEVSSLSLCHFYSTWFLNTHQPFGLLLTEGTEICSSTYGKSVLNE